MHTCDQELERGRKLYPTCERMKLLSGLSNRDRLGSSNFTPTMRERERETDRQTDRDMDRERDKDCSNFVRLMSITTD